MKAIVNSEICIGCGLCFQMVPEVFIMQGDVAVSTGIELAEENLPLVRASAEQCPLDAITIL